MIRLFSFKASGNHHTAGFCNFGYLCSDIFVANDEILKYRLSHVEKGALILDNGT